MSSWSQPIEGDGKSRQWPWEDAVISAAEYEHSLQGLKGFVAEVRLTNILTLEDLSAAASLVGHDIAIVVASKGREIEKQIVQILSKIICPLALQSTQTSSASISENDATSISFFSPVTW